MKFGWLHAGNSNKKARMGDFILLLFIRLRKITRIPLKYLEDHLNILRRVLSLFSPKINFSSNLLIKPKN